MLAQKWIWLKSWKTWGANCSAIMFLKNQNKNKKWTNELMIEWTMAKVNLIILYLKKKSQHNSWRHLQKKKIGGFKRLQLGRFPLLQPEFAKRQFVQFDRNFSIAPGQRCFDQQQPDQLLYQLPKIQSCSLVSWQKLHWGCTFVGQTEKVSRLLSTGSV